MVLSIISISCPILSFLLFVWTMSFGYYSELNELVMDVIFYPIECSINGYIGEYTFEGDTDGSDNLEQIGASLSTRAQNLTDDEVAYWYPAGRPFDDTENESLYPAFYFTKNYAKQSKSHVYGTRYE